MEDVIYDTIKTWLLHKNDYGEFVPINLQRELVYAINDEKYNKVFSRFMRDAARKTNIIKELAKAYKNILFLDDDERNIQSAKRARLQNVTCMKVGWE